VPYRYRTLAFLFFLSVITYLDRVCISVAGPRMQAALNLDTRAWGWVVGAFTLGYALFEIPGGIMADRWGARRALTRIVILWSLFTCLTGLTTSFAALLLVRFLFGVGEAGAFPGATSAIGRWFPTGERSRAQGVVWMASRIGGALTAILVVPLQRAWGWRTCFFVFGALGVFWCVAWFLWYRDRPRDKRGITAAELALIEGSGPPRAHRPVVWRNVIRQGNFWKLLGMYHLYTWGAFFYLSWLPTYLQKGRGFSEQDMKFWAALPFVLGAVGNLAGGELSDHLVRRHGLRFGRRVVGTCGLTLGALFLFAAGLIANNTLAALCLCLGFGAMDSFMPSAWALTLDLGRGSAGTIAGAMNMAGQLASFLSSVAFGYLIVFFHGSYSLALLPLAALTLVGALVFSRIDATRPLVPEDLPAAPSLANGFGHSSEEIHGG
jgi:ACS family glucarate transporter-like MFS transporter